MYMNNVIIFPLQTLTKLLPLLDIFHSKQPLEILVVCNDMYMYVYVHVQMYMYNYVCMYNTTMCVCVQVCMHVFTVRMCNGVPKCMCRCVGVCALVRILSHHW